MTRLRVVIFEDEPIIALDIQEAVENAACIVCGVFKDSKAVEAICAEIKPDVAVIDLNLQDGATGADLAKYLHDRGCEIIIFSGSHDLEPKLCRFSHTFIGKPLAPHLLTEALRPSGSRPALL